MTQPRRKASELDEGEWISYSPSHNVHYVVMFQCDHAALSAYIYHVYAPMTGVHVFLDGDALNRWQQELLRNGAAEVAHFFNPE